jgi:hypothetical protein
MKRLNLNGQKFGKLSVVSPCESRGGALYWVCLCECGNVVTIKGANLVFGITKSCGCLQKEMLKARRTTHGHSGTQAYYTWFAIIKRCYNKDRVEYKNYGARGITVCEEWRSDPTLFCAWMVEKGYRKGLTVERINNDGNYSPQNCRLATRKEQSRNTRTNRFIEINGETRTVAEWAEKYNLKYDTVRFRLIRGYKGDSLIAPAATKFERWEKHYESKSN